MSRFLRQWPIIVCPPVLLIAMAACDEDVETAGPASTSTTTTSTGGSGGSTTTSTGGVGGVGPGGGGSAGAGGEMMACMGPLTGADTCPGDTIDVSLGAQMTLCGDTSTGNAGDSCPFPPCEGTGSDGPDLVYQINILDQGTLKLQVRQDVGSTLNPTIYARSAQFGSMMCDDPNNYYGCWAFFDTHEEFSFDNFPETFWLFVDGEAGTAGRFALDISLTPPTCGDGVTNEFTASEQCDDGNTVNGDGCSSNCQFEVVTLFDTCPGEPVVLLPNQPQTLQGNTTGYNDDYLAMSGGGCNPAAGGLDRVYEIVAGANGTISATIGLDGMTDICAANGLIDPGCWDYVLWAVGPDQCADMAGTQLACSDQKTYGPETISFPATQGSAYYIIVDGYAEALIGSPTYGPYNLQLSLTP